MRCSVSRVADRRRRRALYPVHLDTEDTGERRPQARAGSLKWVFDERAEN